MKTLLKSMLIVASLSLTMAACDDDDDSNNTNNNNVTCVDVDGDGYGTNCALGPDCDDNDNTIHENCPNCVDNDGDGYGAGCANGPDCDDNDNTIHENCPNCVDNDGDGYGAGCALGPDCDDNDDTIHENCTACVDNDGDGYGAGCALGPDCDDNDDTIHENCTTCVDNDGDGYGEGCALGPDCDDNDDTIHENCNANCGNDVVDGTEVCDGDDHDGATCADFGYNNGVLNCKADCSGFELIGCYNSVTTCGNNVREAYEQCDGTDMPSCTDWGMEGGTTACNADCTIDLSGCTGDLCTAEGYYGDGWCDSCDIYGGIVDSDCTSTCHVSDGQCGSYFDSNLGMTTCLYYEGVEDPDCDFGICGDDIINDFESCDGTQYDGTPCGEVSAIFAGGTITCAENCTIDMSQCVLAACGDNIISGTESCDGTALGTATCGTVMGAGYTGVLGCASDCTFDTSACVGAVCGDDTKDGTELCDGTDLGSDDCTTVPGGFVSGTLKCAADCTFDTSTCVAPVCGDGTIEGAEDCEGSDLNGNDCTTITGGYTGGTLTCAADCTFDVSQCEGGAGAWTCNATYYGTGDGCDCGCGVVDPDCADSTSGSCAYQYCPAGYIPDATQNWLCVELVGWTCNSSYYGDGDCDCGCGIIDTDCADGTSGSCVYDNCATGTSPDPAQNWLCI